MMPSPRKVERPGACKSRFFLSVFFPYFSFWEHSVHLELSMAFTPRTFWLCTSQLIHESYSQAMKAYFPPSFCIQETELIREVLFMKILLCASLMRKSVVPTKACVRNRDGQKLGKWRFILVCGSWGPMTQDEPPPVLEMVWFWQWAPPGSKG